MVREVTAIYRDLNPMTNRARLDDLTWQKILAFLLAQPDIYVGEPRKCRRFINGVLWMTRTGAQWRELPGRYGKWNSVYRRFLRWNQRNVWSRLMIAVADCPDLEHLIVDSSVVRAHACAAGAKGGKQTRHYVVGVMSVRVFRQAVLEKIIYSAHN